MGPSQLSVSESPVKLAGTDWLTVFFNYLCDIIHMLTTYLQLTAFYSMLKAVS